MPNGDKFEGGGCVMEPQEDEQKPMNKMIKRLRLQYASNLFVDSSKQSFESLVRPAAASLALCGNIGRIRHPRTTEFLRHCSQRWEKIYWILGPHDVSVADPKDAESCYDLARLAAEMAAEANRDGQGHIHLLCGSEHWIKPLNIVVVGATLWHLPLVGGGSGGYPNVYEPADNGELQPVSTKTVAKWHKEDYDYMYMRRRFWMLSEPNANLVYLTHHLPSVHLVNRSVVESSGPQALLEVSPLNKKNMTAPVEAWIGGASGSCSNGILPGQDDHPIHCAVNSRQAAAVAVPHPGYRPDMVLDVRSRGPPVHRDRAAVQYLPPVLTSLFRPPMYNPIPALA